MLQFLKDGNISESLNTKIYDDLKAMIGSVVDIALCFHIAV